MSYRSKSEDQYEVWEISLWQENPERRLAIVYDKGIALWISKMFITEKSVSCDVFFRDRTGKLIRIPENDI